MRWLIPLAFLAFLRYWKASALMAQSEGREGAPGVLDNIQLFDNEEPQLATFEGAPEGDERPEVVLQEEEDDNSTEVFKLQVTISLARPFDTEQPKYAPRFEAQTPTLQRTFRLIGLTFTVEEQPFNLAVVS